jgi:hypothetical protein
MTFKLIQVYLHIVIQYTTHVAMINKLQLLLEYLVNGVNSSGEVILRLYSFKL